MTENVLHVVWQFGVFLHITILTTKVKCRKMVQHIRTVNNRSLNHSH